MGDNGRARIAKANYRHNCGRLLFRGLLIEGSVIEVRCPRCGMMMRVDTRKALDKGKVPAKINSTIA